MDRRSRGEGRHTYARDKSRARCALRFTIQAVVPREGGFHHAGRIWTASGQKKRRRTGNFINMKIIDISLPLNSKTPIYPENVPLSINIHHAMPEYSTQLSSITFGSHTGTHIDAPGHAVEGAFMIDKIPLQNFIGSCRVLDFSDSLKYLGEAVTEPLLKNKNIKRGERIL